MALNPFPGWLNEVVADPIVVCRDDINAEAHGNLWTFGRSPEQRAAIKPAEPLDERISWQNAAVRPCGSTPGTMIKPGSCSSV